MNHNTKTYLVLSFDSFEHLALKNKLKLDISGSLFYELVGFFTDSSTSMLLASGDHLSCLAIIQWMSRIVNLPN